MKNNLIWVDVLKSIGIIMVVIGHFDSPYSSFIFSWHMPLFFFLAGFFFNSDAEVKSFFNKSFQRLMIPFFIFSFVGILAEFVKRILLSRAPMDMIDVLIGVFWKMDYQSLQYHYGYVLWFLPSLFIARLILYATDLYLIHYKFMKFFIVWILFFCSFYVDLPFAIDNGFNAALFVYLGTLFYNYFKNRSFPVLLFLLILPIVFYYFYTQNFPVLNLAEKYYSKPFENLIWFFSMGLALSLVFQKITLHYNLSQAYGFLGRNSMLIFIFHVYTNNIATILTRKTIGSNWVVEFLVSFLLIGIILVFKSKFPKLGIFKYV